MSSIPNFNYYTKNLTCMYQYIYIYIYTKSKVDHYV